MRVALFVTCVADTLFPETGRTVVRVLERLGHEVVFPAEQTCCGQMHVNSGYRDEALRLARRLVDVMGRDDGVDAVVSPSSSCVGWLRELLPGVAREAGRRAAGGATPRRSAAGSSSSPSSSSAASAWRTSARRTRGASPCTPPATRSA